MSTIDNEILLGAEEDAKEVAFIYNYIGQENRENFSEDDIYYCIDVVLEYLEKLSSKADADGYIDVDIEDIVKHIEQKAKKEGMGPYDHDALLLLVDAELEYNEQAED
ncbi:MAG: hypothetical protein IJV06_05270 [Bacteroidaceae bacterium]|nr:hypothetical protein [Bacteroidaceae bacterium]